MVLFRRDIDILQPPLYSCAVKQITHQKKKLDEWKKEAVVCVLPLASSVEPGFLSPSCSNQTILDCQSTFLDATFI